jgi:hypothetical protein
VPQKQCGAVRVLREALAASAPRAGYRGRAPCRRPRGLRVLRDREVLREAHGALATRQRFSGVALRRTQIAAGVRPPHARHCAAARRVGGGAPVAAQGSHPRAARRAAERPPGRQILAPRGRLSAANTWPA